MQYLVETISQNLRGRTSQPFFLVRFSDLRDTAGRESPLFLKVGYMAETFEVRDMRHKEKFFVDDAYINGYARYLDPGCGMVYFALCRHADVAQKSFPGMKMLSEKLNMGVRSIIRKIGLLEEHGLINKEKHRAKSGKFLHNVYYLLDKKSWKKYQVPNLHMADQVPKKTPPCAKNDKNQVPQWHTKDTHKKDTHKKENGSLLNTVKDVEELCISRLNNIATQKMIRDALPLVAPKYHWVVSRFLEKKYEDGAKVFREAKR